MTTIILAIALLTAPEPLTGTVARSIDGDTIVLASGQHIRLSGIDAPDRGQPYWGEAKRFLEMRADGKEVVINVVDSKDRDGRIVGHCYIEGVSLEAQLVEQGWAWQAPKYSTDSKLAALQAAAQSKRIGLWGGELKPIEPWEWRKLDKAARDKYRAGEGRGEGVATSGIVAVSSGVLLSAVVWLAWRLGAKWRGRVQRIETLGPAFDVRA